MTSLVELGEKSIQPLTWLFGVQRGLWRAVLHAYLIVLASSVLAAALMFKVAHIALIKRAIIGEPFGFWDVMGSVVLAPAVETLILAFCIWVISMGVKSPLAVCGLSALVGAGLHGLTSFAWFIGTYFGFFVFSFMYVEWRKVSFKKAILVALLPHMLVNGTILGARWLGQAA